MTILRSDRRRRNGKTTGSPRYRVLRCRSANSQFQQQAFSRSSHASEEAVERAESATFADKVIAELKSRACRNSLCFGSGYQEPGGWSISKHVDSDS